MLKTTINLTNISRMLNGTFSGIGTEPWKVILIDVNGRPITQPKNIVLNAFYGSSEVSFVNSVDLLWRNLYGALKYINIYRDVSPETPDGDVLVNIELNSPIDLFDDSFTVILTSSVLSFSGNLTDDSEPS